METISPANTETPTPTKEPEKSTPEITRKQMLIEKYGRARTVPAFEYHGDVYSMFDGGYNMDVESFYKQMKWLSDNDYYALTGEDLLAFLESRED